MKTLLTIIAILSLSPAWVMAQSSLNFNGDNAYAEIEQNNAIDFTGDFTIEFWVKADDLSERYPVFSTRLDDNNGSFQIELGRASSLDGNGRVSVSGVDTWLFESNDDAIIEGAWTHIAYTRGKEQNLYINGVSVSDNQRNEYTITNNSEPYRLASNQNVNQNFNGNITELRVWDNARTATEIHHAMSDSLIGNEDHLEGYWRFNSGTGSTFNDLTSNGNNGTLYGGASWSSDLPVASISGITGIDFDTDSGDRTVSVDSNFTAYGLSFSPSDLTLNYNSSEDIFSIFGSASVSLGGNDVDFTIGDVSSAGLTIEDKELTKFEMVITDGYELFGLNISPDHQTFRYDIPTLGYQIYGPLSFTLEGEPVSADMGTENNPGLIVKGGTVGQVDFGIINNFSLIGLEIITDTLNMKWVNEESSKKFHMYGSADFDVDHKSMRASFGSMSNPGIVLDNGDLKSLDIKINSNIDLGNIDLIAKELRVDYIESSKEMFVTGKAEIEELFELTFDLGDGSDGKKGLVIDVSGSVPEFKVKDLTIELGHANLGTIDQKNFLLHFDENGIIESEVDVVFPSGKGFGGKIKFTDTDPVKLDEIEIFYVAKNLSVALEIMEGIKVAYLSGKLGNLDNPHHLTVSSDIQYFYGDGFTLAGNHAAMMQSGIDATISYKGIKGDTYLNIGAYMEGGRENHVDADNSPNWHHLIGNGKASYNIYFPHKSAKIYVHTDDFPLAVPFIDLLTYLHLSGESFDFMGKVTFKIPHIKFHIGPWHVDFGGKKIGSADGAMRYKYKNLHDSYIAAWGKLDFKIYHPTIGIKYNLGSSDFGTIGSGTVHTINDQFFYKSVSGATNYNQSVHTFELKHPTPNNITLDLNWHQIKDSVRVTVIGPDGLYSLRRALVVDNSDDTALPTFDIEEDASLIADDSVASFFLSPLTFLPEEGPDNTNMTPGRYQMVVSYPGSMPDSTSVQVKQTWNPPEVKLQVVKNDQNNYEINLDYWSPLSDSTLLSIHVSDTLSTEGGKLITHLNAENFDDDNYGSLTYQYVPDFVPDSDTLYFYAIIEDKVNVPVKSEISEAHHHQSDLSGTFKFPAGADSLKAGVRVFLDENKNGSFDVESTGGLENYGITDEDGTFHVIETEHGSHELRAVLPRGYRIVDTENRYGHIDLNFDGTPVQLEIEIETYTEN